MRYLLQLVSATLCMVDFVSHLYKYRGESHDWVNEVSGACHKHCKTWQQAIRLYSEAYSERCVEACPKPGSIYWTMPISPAPTVSSHEGHSKGEHECTHRWPGSVPAGISNSKSHTWIRAGFSYRVTQSRESKTRGFSSTCGSTGTWKYYKYSV